MSPKPKSSNQLKPPKAAPKPNFGIGSDLQRAGFKKIIGLDEVGRGALAGPIVVAAVEINEFLPPVRDSKLLARPERALVAEQIHRAANLIRFGSVSHAEIDELGLTEALALAYERALADIDADLFLTDFVSLPNRQFVRAIKGDQLFYPVAAASIVAKVYRDQLMNVYHHAHPHFGWQTNVGYATNAHVQALRHHGPSALHRQSFLNFLK